MLARLPLAGLVCTIALLTPLTLMPVMAEGAIAQTTTVQSSLEQLLATGKQQYRQADFKGTIATYQQILTLAKQNGNPTVEAEALLRLGEINHWIGQGTQAEELLRQALKVAQSNQNLTSEGEALAQSAVLMRDRQEFDQALATLERALAINRRAGDRRGEALSHLLKGTVLHSQEKYAEAWLEHQQALGFADRDSDLQVFIYDWMAIAQFKLKNIEQAKILHQKQQDLSRSIGYRLAEFDGLATIIQIQQDQKQQEQVIQSYQRRADLARSANNHWFERNALMDIGFIYAEQKQLEKGLEFYQQALAIAQTMDDEAIGFVQNRIGIVYYRAKKYAEALPMFRQALGHYQKTKNQTEIIQLFTNISETYEAQKNHVEAIAAYHQAILIAESVNNSAQQAKLWSSIGVLYNRQKDYLPALDAYQKSLVQWQKVKNPLNEAKILHLITSMYILQGWKVYNANDYTNAEKLGNNALESAKRIWTIAETIADPESKYSAQERISSSESFLADVSYAAGDFSKALKGHQQALASWQKALVLAQKLDKPDKIKRAWFSIYSEYRGLTLDYSRMGQHEEAIALLPKMLAAAKNSGDPEAEEGYRDEEYTTYSSLIFSLNEPDKYDRHLELSPKFLALNKERQRQSTNDLKAQQGFQTSEQLELALVAQIYHSRGQYQQALAINQRLLTYPQEVRNSQYRLWALGGIGSIYERQGNYPEALKYHEQALVIARNNLHLDSKLGVQSNIAIVHARQGNYEKAKLLWQEGLESSENDYTFFNREITPAIIQRICRWAEAFRDSKDFIQVCQQTDQLPSGSSLKYFQGFHQQKRDGARLSIAKAHNNFCVGYTDQAEYPRAIESCQKAIAIAQDLKDRNMEAVSIGNLGLIYSNQGNYTQAIEAFQKAKTISQELKQPDSVSNMTSAIAQTYQRLGQYDQAIATYQESLAIVRKLKAQGLESSILLTMAQTYNTQGKLELALQHYQQSQEIVQRNGSIGLQARISSGMAEVYLKQSQPQKAFPLLQQALATQQKMGVRRDAAETLNIIGGAQAKFDRISNAQTTFQQSLSLAQQINDRPTQAQALTNLANLYAKTQPELAIALYKNAVSTYEEIRKGLALLPKDQQQSYTETVAKTYRDLADLLLKNDRILEARQVIELLKLQELDDYSRDTRGQASPLSILKAETALLNAFNQQVTAKYTSLFQATQELETLRSQPEKSPTIQKRIRDLETLETQGNAIATQFLRDPTIKAHIQTLQNNDKTLIPTDDNLNQLAETLTSLKQSGQTAAILYPLILDDRLEIILITSNGPPLRRTVKIDRKTINETINQFGLDISDPDSNPKATAQQLYQWLVKPIEADLQEAGINTLIYSPDRRLRSVPLAALHDGQQWLIEKYQISHITATSATNLTTRRNASPKVLSGTISDQSTTTYNVKLQSNPKPYEFNGLPSGKVELNAISQAITGSKNLIENDFSSDRLRDNASQYNILHLATHGYFELGQPENSFLLFSQPDSQGKNYATITDIRNWKLRGIDLVTLSACQTAVAPEKLDEKLGILGISHEFERAGARSTIASLWRVNDRSTSLLMQAFYQNLSQGKTKAEALKNAQTTMLRINTTDTVTQAYNQLNRSLSIKPTTPLPTTTPKPTGYSHPYYWAPFILIGNSL
jgi:CHAT domain-containing protein